MIMVLSKSRLIARHLWLDAADADRALPPAMLTRLAGRIAASEGRHTGQIRICAEAALPMSYLWRTQLASDGDDNLPDIIRQRAVMQFSKLRLWDTEHNNGVLIYLQMAEHAIEVVADRGLSSRVPHAEWLAMTRRMSESFRAGAFEEGLTTALEEVSMLLVTHFPQAAGQARRNELPDEPLVG